MKPTNWREIPFYSSNNVYVRYGKWIVDYLFALLLLPVWLPVVVILLSLTWLITRENPLFVQKRAGKQLKPFWIYKIRTFYKRKSLFHEKWGGFLRATGLDELPQVWNILRGEMSWIGPRPLFFHYVNRYTDLQKKRHLVKPGITGLAQIEGRNALSWEQKFALDLHYVSHLHFWLDLFIALKTLGLLWVSLRQPTFWKETEPFLPDYQEISLFNHDTVN